MCANYLPSRKDKIAEHFGVPSCPFDYPPEAFPGYMAPIIRRVHGVDAQRECARACFGMVPHWADLKFARSTYNARTETVAEKPAFRDAWQRRQFCIIPAQAIFEPRYDADKPVRWRIERDGGEAIGIAGIWQSRPGGPDGQPLLSFSMLTINAEHNPLLRQFHKPGDEKRMVIILEPEQYDDWLQGLLAAEAAHMPAYPAQRLSARPDPLQRQRQGKHARESTSPARRPAGSGRPDQGELF